MALCRWQVLIRSLVLSPVETSPFGRDVLYFHVSYSTVTYDLPHQIKPLARQVPASGSSHHLVRQGAGMQHKYPGTWDGLWSHHPAAFPSSTASFLAFRRICQILPLQLLCVFCVASFWVFALLDIGDWSVMLSQGQMGF